LTGYEVIFFTNMSMKIKVTFYEINRNGSDRSGKMPGYASINIRDSIYDLIFLENIFFVFFLTFFHRKGMENQTAKFFEF
jgi:hypothetical protein